MVKDISKVVKKYYKTNIIPVKSIAYGLSNTITEKIKMWMKILA